MNKSSNSLPASLSRNSYFENPFDDINANLIEPHRLLSLWCSPFTKNSIITDDVFKNDKMPIILEGTRGSGKTTVLKYFSFAVQSERAKSNNLSLINQIRLEKSIGFYFRCDDAFINTAYSLFQNKPKEHWLSFFEHYFELMISRFIVSLLKELIKENKICENEINTLINNSQEIITLSDSIKCNLVSLDELVYNEIKYINRFRNDSIFENATFNPSHLFGLFTLSSALIKDVLYKLICNKISFLVLVDEYENLTTDLQQLFNTKIKFSTPFVSIRIGRRSEGTVTTATINNNEYLRVDHDYKLFALTQGSNIKEQREYFFQIAQKRLEESDLFSSDPNIINILGDMEDLDTECKSLCKGKTDHLISILSERHDLKNNYTLLQKTIDEIRFPDNPIAETLNALWVIRNKNSNAIEAAQQAYRAMLDFFDKKENILSKKYRNDYNNKYRYSITALLASIYKKKKLYYGFNALVHLSDNNARTFLNYCKSIFNDAFFYERQEFFLTNKISKEAQNRAILEFSVSEFESICSIINFGDKIRNLILGIGNVFYAKHKDKRLRYPETTQFSFIDFPTFPQDYIEIINTAENWSLIIKREKAQRVSIDINKKGELYRLNKAFCPIFGISYRTRGGYNECFSVNDIGYFIKAIHPSDNSNDQNTDSLTDEQDYSQITLFDLEDSSDE